MNANRIRDLFFYVVIALAVGLGIAWFAYSGPPRESDAIARWGGLAVNTAILFGYMIKDSRNFWRATPFWTLMVSTLVAHLLVFSYVLLRVTEWRVSWFLVMYPIEVPLFLFLRERILARKQSGDAGERNLP